MNIYSIIGERI